MFALQNGIEGVVDISKVYFEFYTTHVLTFVLFVGAVAMLDEGTRKVHIIVVCQGAYCILTVLWRPGAEPCGNLAVKRRVEMPSLDMQWINAVCIRPPSWHNPTPPD